MASVLLDNEDGVRLGMQHVLSKGYKRIGFVTVELQQVQMVQRQTAYEQILEERGVAEGEHFILKLPFNYQHDFAVDQIKRFIVDQRLDAILFSTNYLGIMGIESIAQLKLQIPRDLAVVCFDNHDLFKLYPPGITTINQPLQAMAHAAIENLVEQIESGKGLSPKHIQLKAELIVRGST